MTELTKNEYRQIAHHTMNLYQVEMGGLTQRSELVENSLLPTKTVKQRQMAIFVKNENLLKRIRIFSGQVKKVGVLNFASPIIPGGNFRNGINAQEQTLCRNTFLYPELLKFRRKYYYYHQLNENRGFYSQKMIVSQHVKVLRDESEKKYLQPAYYLDFVSMAAPDVSLMKQKGFAFSYSQIKQAFISRIIQILRAFKNLQEDSLILGAFGCGDFQNDPYLVAEAFREVLRSTEFNTTFAEVYFSILDPAQAKIFSTILCNPPKRVLDEV